MVDYEYIYRYDVHGSIRFWKAQRDGRAYRSVTGVIEGTHVESDWRYAEPKNVGRSNETTAEEQADAEIQANYRKRLELGWSYDPATSGSKFIKPMLAAKYDDEIHRFLPDETVFVQPKLDGIRCVVTAEGMTTRNGKEIVSCSHVWESLKKVGVWDRYPDLVLDGELYNHRLKNDFNTIASLVRKTKPSGEDVLLCEELVQYHVYDGWIDPSQNFSSRWGEITYILDQMFDTNETPVRTVRTWKMSVQSVDSPMFGHRENISLYEEWLADGYEGMMIRLDTPYENKRTRALLKRKPDESAEFPVVRVEEGVGNWSGKVKRFVIRLPDGSEQGAGVRGTMETMTDLLISTLPDWATVKYQNITPDGKLRFPVVTDYGWEQRND